MQRQRMLIGLIGANILGSLSPALFAEAFAAAGIDGFYHLIDVDRVPERRLPHLLASIKAAGFAGANITYPFKQEILSLLDAVDEEAAQVGAVNTVAIGRDGRATGYNFDRAGFRHSFVEGLGSDSATGATVVQIGAGGAGRAVAFALMDLGVTKLVLHDRDAARAAALSADVVKHFGTARCRIADDLEGEIEKADGVVNATQMGMRGFPGNAVPAAPLHAGQWAADVIYTPIETEFLQAAAGKGLRTLDGGGMCVNQAVEAFRLFTGIEPDLSRLRQAFAAGLAAREQAVTAPP